MKRNNFLFFLPFAVVLLTLSACTVADEFDVFHRDGKTYITSLRVHTGVPDAEELGTRTFFDTRDDYYGTVYWEDGKTIFEGKDSVEGTFGPDHLYFFNYNLDNYQYVNSISDYFCAEQYSGEHSFYPEDRTKHQWATFKLQKRTPALQVYKNEGDPVYFGYYCPALETTKPGVSVKYEMSMFDQTGQGNAVLRSFLRRYDVLRLEVPQPAVEGEDGLGKITYSDHSFQWKDTVNQDIYFNHIFSLVEVDIASNEKACTKWIQSSDTVDDDDHQSSPRRADKVSKNGMNAGDESSTFNRLADEIEPYGGNLSYLPLGNVELVGDDGAFLSTYSFNGRGKWICASTSNKVRCTRIDPNKNAVSLLFNTNDTVKYYFLVYSSAPTSFLQVGVQTPRYEPGFIVSEAAPFNRSIKFTMENGFQFEPGKYYKLILDLGLPNKVSTAVDKSNNEVYDENGIRLFLDKDWQTSDYHLLAPSSEMNNIRWGISFNPDGTIPYKELNY